MYLFDIVLQSFAAVYWVLMVSENIVVSKKHIYSSSKGLTAACLCYLANLTTMKSGNEVLAKYQMTFPLNADKRIYFAILITVS